MVCFVFVGMVLPKELSGVDVTLRNHGQVEVNEHRVFESLEIGLGSINCRIKTTTEGEGGEGVEYGPCKYRENYQSIAGGELGHSQLQ